MMKPLLTKFAPALRVVALLLIVAIGCVALGGLYQFGKSRLAADVYKQRLADLSNEYATLRDTYNEAVKRTAVTELQVKDGAVCIAIRTADGQEHLVNTPYDSKDELYVDYVVVDGRLWIRRVYDDKTPPRSGVVIDPKLADVEWSHESDNVGKAIYRSLSEGRWIVTVSGDGSLNLNKVDEEEVIELAQAPKVRDYPQIEKEIESEIQKITARDVFGWFVGSD